MGKEEGWPVGVQLREPISGHGGPLDRRQLGTEPVQRGRRTEQLSGGSWSGSEESEAEGGPPGSTPSAGRGAGSRARCD